MNVTTWLWPTLRDLFEEDDGSLPEIRVDFENPTGVSQGFALLRDRAKLIRPENPQFWSTTAQEEVALESVENAAALVYSGDAESFHVVFSGIEVETVVIPDLGAFVFPEQLALDYRMGVDWTAENVGALFELLLEITSLDPKATLSLEEGVLPEVAERFQMAWSRWIANHAA